MSRISICLIAVVLIFTICAWPSLAQDQATADAKSSDVDQIQSGSPPAEYKIQSEDAMKIAIWGEPDLSAEQVVDPKGYINIPLLGQIYVEGLTQNEFIDKLKEGLATYLVEPKVQITMVQFRKNKVYVLGQVNKPGFYEFKMGDRVMEAIAQAGSFTELAYLEGATLTHKGSDQAIPLDMHKLFFGKDMSQNLVLENGDTIYVPEDTKNKYYVLGEVMRPGMYRLKEDITVVDAVSVAGGPKERGSLKGASIIRRQDQKKAQRIKVNIDKLIKSADITQNIVLQPGDVVYVPETSNPDWQKIGTIVSSIVNTAYLFRAFN